MTLPAFRVVFAESPTKKLQMTVGEFLVMPIDVRVRAILERRVEFFQHGLEVPRQEALNAIRRATALAS